MHTIEKINWATNQIKYNGVTKTSPITISIFTLLLVVIQYTPVTHNGDDTYIWSFSSLFIFYSLYVFPSYILGGFPYSILSEHYLRRINSRGKRYLYSLLVYAFGGTFLGIILTFMLTRQLHFQVYYIAMFSVIAALLFMHISLLLELILKTIKESLANKTTI